MARNQLGVTWNNLTFAPQSIDLKIVASSDKRSEEARRNKYISLTCSKARLFNKYCNRCWISKFFTLQCSRRSTASFAEQHIQVIHTYSRSNFTARKNEWVVFFGVGAVLGLPLSCNRELHLARNSLTKMESANECGDQWLQCPIAGLHSCYRSD